MPSSKVFTDFQEFESKAPRNSYDMSKRVYGTYQIGGLYPLACYEVGYGESIEIDIESLYNLLPMVWPLQTPLRAHYYVFYDRWRNCWKNWEDFRFNNKQPAHPFILQPSSNKKFWKTGSLVDHMGIPTTLSSKPFQVSGDVVPFPQLWPVVNGACVLNVAEDTLYSYNEVRSLLFSQYSRFNPFSFRAVRSGLSGSAVVVELTSISPSSLLFLERLQFSSSFGDEITVVLCGRSNRSLHPFAYRYFTFNNNLVNISSASWTYRRSGDFMNLTGLSWSDIVYRMSRDYSFDSVCVCLVMSYDFYRQRNDLGWSFEFQYSSAFGSLVDLTSDGVSNPFAGSVEDPPKIPLNALPFRSYERVYNVYFRDEKNDPFVIDGEVQYNKFETTDEDGADTTPYELKFRNWNKDFLTTATPTPQQGVAPLVGINYRGDMEFQNEDGTIARIRPTIAADGHTVTGITGVLENGTPESLRSALDLVSMGISINDLRQVGALQRFLEDNIRRGLRYRDQVLANTGISIKYDELDLPEFIGGFSRPVQVSQVTQMTPEVAGDSPNALGSRAGQASVYAKQKHKVRHYCDEAGCVMVIMCITPEPVYTQLLPKMFMKSDCLSYYNQQFGHIGMQPISYREVCPVQCANFGYDMDKTFGYQRAWYDLISAVDEAHGQFRLPSMRDMLMQRTFAGVPVLGRDFLHIDPAQLNDVFAYRNPDPDAQEDVIAGQTYIQCYMKRPIPRFGIPRFTA